MRFLKLSPEPFRIELAPGISVTARPMTTLDMAVAQAAASRRLERLEDSTSDCMEAGFLPEKVDMTDPAVRGGLFHEFVIDELAVRHIIAIEGASMNGDPVPTPPPPEIIRAAMAVWPLGETFYRRFAEKHMELLAAKKDSGDAAPGTLAAGPGTASNATATPSPAPPESRG